MNKNNKVNEKMIQKREVNLLVHVQNMFGFVLKK